MINKQPTPDTIYLQIDHEGQKMKTKKKTPKTIYLQTDQVWEGIKTTTWSTDPSGEHNIEYVRKDIADQAEQRGREEAMNKVRDKIQDVISDWEQEDILLILDAIQSLKNEK